MKIGVPKEIKDQEERVGATPSTVASLIHAGHTVVVEAGAGVGSGYLDEDYTAQGATLGSAAEAWDAEMIIKVKEPLPSEYGFFKKGMIVYTYLHLAADRELTDALLANEVTGVAYETMVGRTGGLPLLFPMSEIAGRMSIQVGAHFLESAHGGKGILLPGVTGVHRGKVTIIGAGTVGFNAAKVAVGMGAQVTILDINAQRLAEVDNIFNDKIQTLISNPHNIKTAVEGADLVIGAVLIPGASAPKLVTEDMIKNMADGGVIVDIPIDQGGIFETSTHATTHDDPVYVSHGIIHYTVANIPGAVPKTSTDALTSATVGYAIEIANKGIKAAADDNNTVFTGINTFAGQLTSKAVADSLDLPFAPFQ
ncbi:alanine dehydrogenase [Secundilactobacillus odoratitofui DSM 19909 = JCM 15043]|uniref:Alanine dehydrogenase n=1 Tax=Secundilactobacillus odoratitofui DSM 19909 = JCM 15043 TaxID=1423776 RepID=A0A0R1LWD2_9LACO|nr:alanine dehydrogenase [Secundilactobacillus odoratitofui]KRK97161.1 alanine dehydrogenase [Secundilactobacillus odoratitofui DSM 19909 = JCM 15043]